MSILTNVGNLMYLYLDEIETHHPIDVPEFLIQATAKLLDTCGGRNWVPVIVREIGRDKYEVIGNVFIYSVAEAAGLERVWCIVADASDVTADLSRALSREESPKINLSIASRDEITAALHYLISQPASPLKSVQISTAANRIEEAPRQYWKSLDAIVDLKCGITKGKKLDTLKQVFYLTPQPLPAVLNDPAVLATLSTPELKKMAKDRKLKGYTKLKKTELVERLSSTQSE
jgi:Rho termination factor, N-terminal domain